MNSEHNQGFTAIELLVVVALIAVFLALALPSFESTIGRYRASMAASELTNILQFARAQAITTGQNVTVGRSNATLLTGTGCAYADDDNDWSCGISVYVDADSNGLQDADEAAIKTIPPTDFKALNVQIVPNGTTSNNIVYTPLGYATCSAAGCISNFRGFGISVRPLSSHDPTQTICATMGGKVTQYATDKTC